MTTYRIQRHERDYTQIQNSTLRDDRLSFRARGVLAWLLSHVDTWEVSREQVARNGTEGVTAVRTALAELTELGYLERVEERKPDGTIFYVTNVYEVPGGTAGWKSANGSTANGSTANSESHDIEDHLPKDDLEEDDPEPPKPPEGGVEVIDDFDKFWSWYPAFRRVAKKQCRKKFDKAVTEHGVDAVMQGTVNWVTFWADSHTEERFIPMTTTFLNQERFMTDTPPLPKAKPQSAIMESISRIREQASQ
jgi:hypothetical protein